MEQARNVIGTEIDNSVKNLYREESVLSEVGYSRRSIQVARTNVVGKIRIACFFATVALLSFLFIYNFIAMNNLNVNIASLESQIESEQTSIDNLKVQINSLNKENSIMLRVNEAGYSAEYPLNDDILIVDVPKTSSVESTAQSNWFNDFCEFISSVFGG